MKKKINANELATAWREDVLAHADVEAADLRRQLADPSDAFIAARTSNPTRWGNRAIAINRAREELARLEGDSPPFPEGIRVRVAARLGLPLDEEMHSAMDRIDAEPAQPVSEIERGRDDSARELDAQRNRIESAPRTREVIDTPVAATLADAADDPALTLEPAREMLRDTAQAIQCGAYGEQARWRTPEEKPRQGQLMVLAYPDGSTSLFRNTGDINLSGCMRWYPLPPIGEDNETI